jgi:hypothetical protein
LLDLTQTARQLAFLAGLIAWSDAPSNPVLTGGVSVSEDLEENFLTDGGPNGSGPPFALVRYKLAVPDSNHPERDALRVFELVLVARADPRDRHGSTAITGGTRNASQGSGKSQGRGIAEIVGEVRQTFDSLVDSTHGMKGGTSSVGSVRTIDGLAVVSQRLEVTVLGSGSARYYHAPYRLGLSGGSGTINMAWANGPARFDSLGLVARYASGATPPSSPSAGLAVPGFPATGFPTSFSFSPGAGTWSVALFNAFDEVNTPPTTAGRWSPSSILASGTVTV